MPARKTVSERAQEAAAKLALKGQPSQNLHKTPDGAEPGKEPGGLDEELSEGLAGEGGQGGDQPDAAEPEDSMASAATQQLQQRVEELEKENQALKEKAGDAVPSDAWDAANQLQGAREQISTLQRQLEQSPVHQEIAKWEGKDVRILMPWWKLTNPMTALSVCAFALQYGREKLGLIPRFGDSMIYNLRNALADQFLETGAQWSLWLDDDVIAPFGAPSLFRQFTGLTEAEFPDHLLAVNAIEQLKSHPNAKVVGGVYFGRRHKSPPMFGRGMEDVQAYQAAKRGAKGLIETDWVATGCLMVHREVYLAIRKRFPQLCPKGEREESCWGIAYADPNQGGKEVFVLSAHDVPDNAQNVRTERRMVKLPPTPHWQYFAPEPGRGEDVMFCARARAAGFKVYADPSVACLHVGSQAFGLHNTTYPKFEVVPAPGRDLPSGAVFPGQGGVPTAAPQIQHPAPTDTITPQQTGIPGMPHLPTRMGERR